MNWIDSVSIDWPISRRRYYATEMPLWVLQKMQFIYVPPKGKYYRPWMESPPIEKCPECEGTEWRGEERVFDTWFDSSISPLYILGYERYPDFFRRNEQCSLRPQGKEIVRTWLYYTVLKDFLLTDKTIFKDVWVNYHIVDEKGKKMSKSVGNIIDPKDIMNKFGAEPFRLWAAVEGNLEKTDFRCSYDRIEGAGKTITKIWNIARFISMFEKPEEKPELLELDNWIIQELKELVDFAKEKYYSYDFHNPAIKLKHFVWETFSSHYLELVKARAYNGEGKFSEQESNAAKYALHFVLDNLLKVFAPIIPFVTYKLYLELEGKDIHLELFPKIEHDFEKKFDSAELAELNSLIWKFKKDNGLSLRAETGKVSVLEKFRGIEKDLQSAHHAKEIAYAEKNFIEL